MQLSNVDLPKGSLIEKAFHRIDYADAYACTFRSNKNITVNDTVLAFFQSGPKWVDALFTLRNSIVKLFGLKTSANNNRSELLKNFKVEPGNGIGLFKVFAKTDSEALLGEDDSHLNFRISFHLENRNDNFYNFTLSTAVLMNSWFGKVYFLPVRPFHRFIVPTMMKGIVDRLTTN